MRFVKIKETESHTMLDMDLTILDVQGNEIVAVQDNPLVPSILKYGTLKNEVLLCNFMFALRCQAQNIINH